MNVGFSGIHKQKQRVENMKTDTRTNSEKVFDTLYAVYLTEKARQPTQKSNYSPTFINEVEQILCNMDASLMWANHGVKNV